MANRKRTVKAILITLAAIGILILAALFGEGYFEGMFRSKWEIEFVLPMSESEGIVMWSHEKDAEHKLLWRVNDWGENMWEREIEMGSLTGFGLKNIASDGNLLAIQAHSATDKDRAQIFVIDATSGEGVQTFDPADGVYADMYNISEMVAHAGKLWAYDYSSRDGVQMRLFDLKSGEEQVAVDSARGQFRLHGDRIWINRENWVSELRNSTSGDLLKRWEIPVLAGENAIYAHTGDSIVALSWETGARVQGWPLALELSDSLQRVIRSLFSLHYEVEDCSGKPVFVDPFRNYPLLAVNAGGKITATLIPELGVDWVAWYHCSEKGSDSLSYPRYRPGITESYRDGDIFSPVEEHFFFADLYSAQILHFPSKKPDGYHWDIFLHEGHYYIVEPELEGVVIAKFSAESPDLEKAILIEGLEYYSLKKVMGSSFVGQKLWVFGEKSWTILDLDSMTLEQSYKGRASWRDISRQFRNEFNLFPEKLKKEPYWEDK